MKSFTLGDRVQLISGGPVMTVDGIEGTKVTCVWIDSKHKPFKMEYEATSLKLLTDKDLEPSMGFFG